MAAYSYHPHHFLLNSTFFPNTTPLDISNFTNNMLIPSNEFSSMEVQHLGFPDAVVHHQSSCQDHCSKIHSATSSIDMEKVESKKSRRGSSLNSTKSKRRKVQGMAKKDKGCNNGENVEEKKRPKASKKNIKECSDDTLKDYIHVRARRGQATDSHSLAERVRRERISERMKMLQALVPGCEKVTGKALMLDEIINYVQSLQNQIEFLSMKLASYSPIYGNFPMDLDASIIKQERLSAMAASQPSGSSQLCSPTAVDYNSSTTTFTVPTAGFHPLIEISLLQQEAAESMAWNQMDSQTQNFMNQSGLGNAMCSYQ